MEKYVKTIAKRGNKRMDDDDKAYSGLLEEE